MSTEVKVAVSLEDSLERNAAERAALQAVLDSKVFQARPRLASLLQYICERYIDGEMGAIKEYAIATEVFGRQQSFDPATDSIVRVEAFRLRKRLREFYEGEGADQRLEIVIAPGHYRPEFKERMRFARVEALEEAPSPAAVLHYPANGHDPRPAVHLHEGFAADADKRTVRAWDGETTAGGYRHPRWRVLAIAASTLVLLLTLGWIILRMDRQRIPTTPGAPQVAHEAATVIPAGPEIRIRCGYTRPMFKDDEGNVWLGDRFYSGGFVTELPDQHIAGTRDPELYLTARSGVFSYKIPLAQGTYEMHLHFAETTYSPESTLGGGENSRVFDVRLNGRPLLSQFDIVSDAGANTADVRVFRDVSPDKDGYLYLDFNGSLGLPMINAIEILPGLPRQLRPIRMVAQNSFYVDKSGNLWMPDAYFSSGRVGPDHVAVVGTAEPGLFAGERYGNFAYALPVDDGTYKLTLYFSEKYWGVGAAQNQAAGRRVFDIFCNGTALTRRLDIAKEVGPRRALVKVYHNLQPNAQGKLIVSFVPEVNYASVDAVEVEQEQP